MLPDAVRRAKQEPAALAFCRSVDTWQKAFGGECHKGLVADQVVTLVATVERLGEQL